ncbi:MAG TPA: hypothetical protein VFH14_00355, partial [Gemmatimonadaceae bacterium]|nr:hypothetical protein [Gemmatimonadaceae bacterium]
AWIALARHLGLAALSGAVAGILVGGVLGRIAMRISGFAAGPALAGVSTANGERVGDITFGGTLALMILVGLPFGVVGGVLYAIVEPWLRRARPWHGVAYGAGLLLATGFFVLDPSNFDFTRFGPPLLNVAMFAALFLIFGVTIAWLFDGLRALRDGSGRAARITDILAWLSLVPTVIVVMLFVGGTAGLDPLLAILVAAVLLVPAIVRWRGLPRAIGYASLAGVVLFGAARTLSGLPGLLRGF